MHVMAAPNRAVWVAAGIGAFFHGASHQFDGGTSSQCIQRNASKAPKLFMLGLSMTADGGRHGINFAGTPITK